MDDYYINQGKWRDWETLFDLCLKDMTQVEEKSALDFGCGVGIGTQALAKRFNKVIGVDGDPLLIKRAEEYALGLKNLSFQHAEDMQTFDAFGEHFDFIYVGFTLAYLGNVQKTLKRLALMLKQGGTLAVLEIQGLFSIHKPILPKYSTWFERFDKLILRDLGYDCTAGTQLNEAVSKVPELRKIGLYGWNDPELCFSGPLVVGSPEYKGWQDRWKRLWPVMREAEADEGLFEAFFSCLTDSKHECDLPCRLLIAVRTSRSSSGDIESKSSDSKDHDFQSHNDGGGDGD